MNVAVRNNDRTNIKNEKTMYIDKIYVSHKPGYEFMKRAFDIVMSLLAIIFLSPVMLIVSLAVFLEDFHNPFFSQMRLTKDGRFFKMYKFRSMCVNAEKKLVDLMDQNEADGPVFKIKKDPRITKVGAFIRKTSLDELPQLFNILGGSMSFVGPRPPLPREAEQYDSYQQHRLDVKGGLTCYWQCSGRSNLSFSEWMDLDVQYIKERSFKTDIAIIFKTIKSVMKMDGAQ